MRLKPYQTLLTTPSSPAAAWQPEFLQAAPKILPALHALLHWRGNAETALVREDDLDGEPEINSISEEYLKVILQKINPEIFAEQKEGGLPKKDSLRGQIFFTLLPRLIECFMQVDKALKDQIELLVTRDQMTNVLLTTMLTTLTEYRAELAELFYDEIRNLLSPNPEENLQEQETLIQKKILAHALNWPAAILQQEENRLTRRLSNSKEIAVLREGRREITQLTQRCLNEDMEPLGYTEYAQKAQSILRRVEQAGGAHYNFLTVVARIAINIVIFLSAGRLHSFFKKQIQETRAVPVTGFSQYFFSLKSRRAETIHCTNLAVGRGA